MVDEFCRYHPEHAPEGRLFEEGTVSKDLLKEEGWVRNPLDFGYDPTGQTSPADLELHMQRAQSKPVDRAVHDDLAAANEELQAQLKELNERMAEKEIEVESLRTKLTPQQQRDQDIEKALDEINDDFPSQVDSTRNEIDPKHKQKVKVGVSASSAKGGRKAPAAKAKAKPKTDG